MKMNGIINQNSPDKEFKQKTLNLSMPEDSLENLSSFVQPNSNESCVDDYTYTTAVSNESHLGLVEQCFGLRIRSRLKFCLSFVLLIFLISSLHCIVFYYFAINQKSYSNETYGQQLVPHNSQFIAASQDSGLTLGASVRPLLDKKCNGRITYSTSFGCDQLNLETISASIVISEMKSILQTCYQDKQYQKLIIQTGPKQKRYTNNIHSDVFNWLTQKNVNFTEYEQFFIVNEQISV